MIPVKLIGGPLDGEVRHVSLELLERGYINFVSENKPVTFNEFGGVVKCTRKITKVTYKVEPLSNGCYRLRYEL